MSRDDFTTVGAFVQEFKKKARKVHGISEEAQCAIFLGLLTAAEAAELTIHGGGSEKLTWATVDKGVAEGSLNEVEQHQMRLQRRKRKERDATVSGTPGVRRIVTDVLAELGYGKDGGRPAQAARTRGQAKTGASQEPPRKEPEPEKRKEAVEVQDDDEEEEEDERLRQKEDQRAEQRATKRQVREEVESILRDVPPKKKKYAVRLEEGFNVERVIDRLLEGHNDRMTLKEILASTPKLRDGLKERLSRRLVPSVHLSMILPKEAEWAETGTKMDWKCVACGTVHLVVKDSKCSAMVDTGAEMNIIREADAIRFGLEIDRSDCGVLHGANCKAVFCGTASNVLIEVGRVKERALMIELMKKSHRAYAFSDEERGRLDVDIIPMIRIHTVSHEPWNLRRARYLNPDEEKKVVDYLDDRPVTTMHTPRGLIHMNVAPQGWTNAVAMVQRAMIRAMQSVSPHITQSYIDDLAVKGPMVKENGEVLPGMRRFVWKHIQDLDKVLNLLEEHNLTASGATSRHCMKEATILGFVCTEKGRRPDVKKTDKIIEWPVPFRSITDVRSFLDTWGFWRAFIKNFPAKTELLRKLVHKDQEWVWGEEQEKVVAKMKEEFREGGRYILKVDPTALAYSLRNYVPSDLTVARWLTYIWMFNFELEWIPRNKNRADGLSHINWDKQEGEAVENTPLVDSFLDQEAIISGCVGDHIWRAPSEYERKAELVLKPFEEEDPWGGRDVQLMMKLALAGTHSLVEKVRTIEEGPNWVEKQNKWMGGMYFLVNTLLQGDLDQIGSVNPAENEKVLSESQDDEFQEGEIKEAFRAEEYDGIYLELGLLLSCEMRNRDVSDRAQAIEELNGTEWKEWVSGTRLKKFMAREEVRLYEDSHIKRREGDAIAMKAVGGIRRAIERLRGVGRFAEPIAQIRRDARMRPEVEARMQELQPSHVGPDGRLIRLEIGNAEEFIPAFEKFMHGQEEASLFSPEQRIEEPPEGEMGIAVEGVFEGRPQRLGTPEYRPEGVGLRPGPSTQELGTGNAESMDVPQSY
ncbi:hypothetical protein CBR_g37869 [Chara braunii]|uniref:Reverse transcriptase domain-containing protein n=1 Tax=Chara braunii TaxID=69332 RepID=A0A388LNS3_CHABU|nr:hypothetical protein CBR_g37869 [Chara braunii]|eukprot:GBG83996.1 hypothetical protein CBR_g37869 [Chara braunii]